MKKRIDPGYLISLLLSVVLAFAIGAVILAIAGFSPGKAYLAMLNGAFSSARHIGDLLEYAMVLCLCGLACVLGARVGIFNVGGEGQLLLGAIVACQVGVWLDGLTPWLVLPLAALAVVFLSLFFAALKIGAQGMELAAGVPNQIYLIIQTVVIFLMAAESGLFGALQNRVRKGKEAEKHA